MAKLFGTDGIRGKVNTFPLTGDMAFKLGQALGTTFQGKNRGKVLIGKDTRSSGYIFEYGIASGLCSMGTDVFLAGVVPTPAVAHLVRSYAMDIGVVISASHNPAEDNGIKFFDNLGFKLQDDMELSIEESVFAQERSCAENILPEDVGSVSTINHGSDRYIEFAKCSIRNASLKGLKIVLDCANGASYIIGPKVFRELGADVIVCSNTPDGVNINKDCGALHAEKLKDLVIQEKADIGVALDGDADRVIMVDENGSVLDGDKILAVCGLYMLDNGQLKNNTIVGTVMSNFGFELFLKEKGIKLVRTDVGDKYVIQEMLKSNYNLGGEQAGHIILSDFNSTGDGIVTALQVLSMMQKTGENLSQLTKDLVFLPQILKNVKVREKRPLNEMKDVEKVINDVTALLKGEGRVLVRYSGTEKKCRIMVEGREHDNVDKFAQMIANEIKNEIGE